MIIRKIIECDIVQIKDLILCLSGETDHFVYSKDEAEHNYMDIVSYIKKLIVKENGYICAAFKGEMPIGVGFLEGGSFERTHHCAILGLGVLKAFWRKGIGKELLRNLLDQVDREEHIAKIDIQVRIDNLSAIELYRTMGFQVEGKIKRAIFLDNQFYDCLWMGKVID